MFKSLLYLAVVSLVFQAIFAHENGLETDSKHSDEKLSIAVKIIEEDDSANDPRKTEVMVNLNVAIEEDDVKVNGKLTKLDVLVMYELQAEIVYSQDDIRISAVIVHVMISRKQLENGHQYLIEEQVQLIEGKRVEQLDIQVLTIHLDVDGKEYKRTVAMISFEESKMKNTELTHYCGKDDSTPHKWKKAVLPHEGDKWHGHPGDRHHGKSHHGKSDHGKSHHSKSFCSWFHNLPFAARVGFVVGVVFVVLACGICCALGCCRKTKKSYEIQISKDDEFKAEFEMEDEEAEALPEKLAFDDKEVLIA